MREHTFVVNVKARTRGEAERVIIERLGHDEDYGFDYEINIESNEAQEGVTIEVEVDRYTADPDLSPPFPLEPRDGQVWAFNAPLGQRSVLERMPHCAEIKTFAYYYDRTSHANYALELTERYYRAFHNREANLSVHTWHGRSQSDWLEYVMYLPGPTYVLSTEGDGITPPDPTPVALEINMWLQGDVWVVTDNLTGDSLGGIYAEYPETAIKEYLEVR